jgi:hypothetical protein
MSEVTEAADRKLLEHCLSDLQQGGFEAASLNRYRSADIGGAAVRLGRRALDDQSHSLEHPLGFRRIPLTAWHLHSSRVALNVWDNSTRTDWSEDIHDHCYDFVSVCYIGGLEHSIFRVSAERGPGARAVGLRYAAGSCDAADSDQELVDVRVVNLRRYQVTAPMIYSLRNDVLHCATPVGGLTITVQFQSPCMKQKAQVYRRVTVGAGRDKRAPSALGASTRSTAILGSVLRGG